MLSFKALTLGHLLFRRSSSFPRHEFECRPLLLSITTFDELSLDVLAFGGLLRLDFSRKSLLRGCCLMLLL